MTPRQEAVWRLVLKERGVIRRALSRAGTAENDLLDGEQDTLIVAWRLIVADKLVIHEGVEAPRALVRSWLRSIAYWRARRQLTSKAQRQRDAEVPMGDYPENAIVGPQPEARFEARADVRRLVGRCSRAERELLAAAVEGRTLAEIGVMFRTPEGTVHGRLRLIRRHLKKHRGS